MVPETLSKLCVAEVDFLEKTLLLSKLRKWAKNRVFEFKEKFGCYFSLNLFCNENLYFCCRTNPVFVKNLVPEI